jgi:hypothetical protein
MFVRFVVAARDEDSHRRCGVFQAADRLRQQELLTEAERARLQALWRWFERHLPVPRRLSRSRRPHARGRAICWLKATAAEHVGKVRELAAVLQRHGVATAMLRTGRPGYVVYEDAYQVAAVPFRDTVA